MKFIRFFVLPLLFAVSLAVAQQAQLMPVARQQYFSANGTPLAGGSLAFYVTGTTTPLATYTDQTGTIANPNPITLDAGGFAPAIWLTAGKTYRVKLSDATGVLIWQQDAIRGAVSNLGSIPVNVKDYGAQGDGVTDDTTAIANACAASNRGLVSFPPATYKVTAGNISTCYGATLEGNRSTIDASLMASTANVFNNNVGGGTTPVTSTVRNFNLLGNSANTGSYFVYQTNADLVLRDVTSNGLLIANVNSIAGSTIDNVVITNFSGNAVTLATGGYTNAQSVYVQGSASGLVNNFTCYNAAAGATNAVCLTGGSSSNSNYTINNSNIGPGVATGLRVLGANFNGGTMTLGAGSVGWLLNSSNYNIPNLVMNGTVVAYLNTANNTTALAQWTSTANQQFVSVKGITLNNLSSAASVPALFRMATNTGFVNGSSFSNSTVQSNGAQLILLDYSAVATAANAPQVFNGGELNFIADNFYALNPTSYAIQFATVPAAASTWSAGAYLTAVNIEACELYNVTNFNWIIGALTNNRSYISSAGSVTISNSGSLAIANNLFQGGKPAVAPLSALCGNNVGYSCN